MPDVTLPLASSVAEVTSSMVSPAATVPSAVLRVQAVAGVRQSGVPTTVAAA